MGEITAITGESFPLSPETAEKLEAYAALLLEKNMVMNLTAITDPRGIAVRHFLDSLLPLARLPEGAKVIDVGTGAGFPGMVFAIARPDLKVMLLDSLRKRVEFLAGATEALGLGNVLCRWGRAEDAGRDPILRERFDVAAARAVAALPVLGEYLSPFLKVGGLLLCQKGAEIEEELAAARRAFPKVGLSMPRSETYTLPGESRAFHLVTAEKKHPIAPAFPRKAGLPAKKPL
jgi:16S rRNA (guanine527-N7)-methyltransferase